MSRRDRWAPALVIAALLVVLLVWLARRDPGQRIVTVAAAPRIVTVPVPVMTPAPSPVPAPPPPTPAPPQPVHIQTRMAPKQIAPPPAPPPLAPATVQPSDVTTRYREVGQLLHAHGTDELWQRYRWIRLGDCLLTDAKRAECVRMLDAIASDAAGK